MSYFGDGSNLTGITASQISGSLSGACASGGGSSSTQSTSYQNFVSVTITPTQSNSYMLIMATGVVQGKAGNNSNNTSTGYAQVTRDTTQIGSEITAPTSTKPFTQSILDTNNHGGNAVTYRLRLKNGPDSNFTKIARMGCADGTSANTVQGNATLTILEILQ